MTLYRPEQVGAGRSQVSQIVIDPSIGESNGHAPGKGDDDHRRETNQSDEDEQHQKYGHGGDKVVLIQNTELGHVEPVVAELRAVPVLPLHGREAEGGQVLSVKVVGLAGFFRQQFGHQVVGVQLQYFVTGTVYDFVEQGFGKGVAGVHIRNVEEHPILPPEGGKSRSYGGVVLIVQDIASQQHGIAQRFCRSDRQAFSGDHVGDHSHIAARAKFAAALVVQYIGAGAGSQINILSSQGVPGGFGEEGSAGRYLPVLRGVSSAQGSIVLFNLNVSVPGQGGGVHLLPGGDVHIVLLCQSLHLAPFRQVLIIAPVVLKIHRAACKTVRRVGGEHGSVKGSKIGPGNEQRHDQHVPYGLSALEFHHRCGDDVPVFVALAPSVHYRMEQHHVYAY